MVQERASLPKCIPSRDAHSASLKEFVSTGQMETITDFILFVLFFSLGKVVWENFSFYFCWAYKHAHTFVNTHTYIDTHTHISLQSCPAL